MTDLPTPQPSTPSPDPRWCHDKTCPLLEKGVWGHPVSAHDSWRAGSPSPASGEPSTDYRAIVLSHSSSLQQRIKALDFLLAEARATPPALPPVNMLAEAIHSTYSIGCNSHALEECPYQRSKRTPVDFEAWAVRVHDWLERNRSHDR